MAAMLDMQSLAVQYINNKFPGSDGLKPASATRSNYWGKSLDLQRPIVVVDIKATDDNAETARVVEITCIKLDVDGTRTPKTYRVNPETPIAPNEIHGLCDSDVANCRTFEESAGELSQFLSKCDLSGYRLESFDMPILTRQFNEAGISFPGKEVRLLDSCSIFNRYEPRDLRAAYRFYCSKELPNNSKQDTKTDANAAADVLLAQIRRYDNFAEELQGSQDSTQSKHNETGLLSPPTTPPKTSDVSDAGGTRPDSRSSNPPSSSEILEEAENVSNVGASDVPSNLNAAGNTTNTSAPDASKDKGKASDVSVASPPNTSNDLGKTSKASGTNPPNTLKDMNDSSKASNARIFGSDINLFQGFGEATKVGDAGLFGSSPGQPSGLKSLSLEAGKVSSAGLFGSSMGQPSGLNPFEEASKVSSTGLFGSSTGKPSLFKRSEEAGKVSTTSLFNSSTAQSSLFKSPEEAGKVSTTSLFSSTAQPSLFKSPEKAGKVSTTGLFGSSTAQPSLFRSPEESNKTSGAGLFATSTGQQSEFKVFGSAPNIKPETGGRNMSPPRTPENPPNTLRNLNNVTENFHFVSISGARNTSPDNLDPEGKIVWRDNEAVLTFGRHKNQSLQSIASSYERSYLDWMAYRGGFSPTVVKIAKAALRGEFPSPGSG